jgi:hypothetical protein
LVDHVSDERDMPSEHPPRHELSAIADEIVAGIKQYNGSPLAAHDAKRLRNRIFQALIYVRGEAARAWLGAAMTRGARR